ncbi:MAG: O-antigen ligase family protein [Microbacteriaceae bacterium]|nr:O-antigen ligase family protein [Microbacteriaceae bacterium]
MTEISLYRRVLATLGLFTLAAGDFWRYLLGYWGWGALALLLVVLAVIELIRDRADVRRLPFPLLGFLALAVVSIAWSAYPGGSAVGVAGLLATAAFAFFLATALDLTTLVRCLGTALRWILGLSLLFELIVATVIRERVLPFWVDYSDLDNIPAAYYWSRNLLFEGGRIQGIVGNANLLGFAAVLAVLVFSIQIAARSASRFWTGLWLVVALGVLALTRSTTVLVAGVAVAIVALYLWLVRRARPERRTAWFVGGGAVALAGIAAVIVFRDALLGLLGKSPDLTHRLDIWAIVTDLAGQRPVAGWGYVGYWIPWVEPFDDLIVIRGVTYYQAHNAWLDIYLQLGIIGLVVFGLLVLTTVVRGWARALDLEHGRGKAIGLFPILCTVLLLVHSLAESRLLTEIWMALLVIFAIRTWSRLGQDQHVPGRATPA